ncbi:hypothetical protein HMPREF9318_02127 [Streptococcus urinalis FB127-CNA-2]|uniref:PTS cellobiose transporter subunit IIA n=1 Tax=Streptococcus urinalis 2285-97 TaxID=764291 RepID=G5KID6_9STRE|nr:hypothetical protein [Streptococcus urinalis]EHJ57291.1 hypothetical protein STRUR_1647 [Streptococcus urinalis 2285-97]EKS17250.1 hypothetical protein HMPREF9318_02127 [Streptococcus urinalis FB127-CNA-2]VEF32500.1 PTS transporter [Streptococcus urinalis]
MSQKQLQKVMSEKQKSKKTPDQIRTEVKLKNNRFNRFMLLRYSLTLFFFANTYWLITQLFQASLYLIIPALMLILLVIATIEQFRLYGAKVINLKMTDLAFKAQLLVNAFVILISLVTQSANTILPTFSNHRTALIFLILLQVLGMVVAWFSLNRIRLIELNKDNYYKRFQNIEKYI